MKIYVIDNNGQIPAELLSKQPDVSFFADEIQAINALDQSRPQLILLNYDLRGKESARYIDLLLTLSPDSNIVLIGNELSDDQVLPCLLSGAKGYQSSADLAHFIDKIIQVIAADEAWISRRLTSHLLNFIRQQNCLHNEDFYFSGQYVHSAAYQKLH